MGWARIGIAALLAALPVAGFATDGKAVFEKGGCGLCHKADADGIGPSLARISAAYADKKEGLVRFLNGEAEPIVFPGKFAIMRPSLLKTKALADDERGALADFLLSHR